MSRRAARFFTAAHSVVLLYLGGGLGVTRFWRMLVVVAFGLRAVVAWRVRSRS